jgi:transcriptional regulator with XRE-family HTH domain
MQIDTQIQDQKSILSVSGMLLSRSGQKIKGWRKAKGMTQDELALATGVNVSYISNLEREFSANTKSGRPRASEELCGKLAKILGVPEDEVRELYDWPPKSRPANATEFLKAVEKLHPDFEWHNKFGGIEHQDPDEYDALLQDIDLIVERFFRRQRSAR